MKKPTRARAVTLALAAIALTGCSSSGASDDASTGESGASPQVVEVDATSAPPWPAPTDDVPARVAAAGLDLGPMGMAEHYHPKLELIINGNKVPVAPNIGVDPSTGAMSALHTHEPDGTIHIEADVAGEKFTLGQLFRQWGIKLSRTQIGGVTTASGESVSVTSNGESVSGDPADLRLEADQMIVVELP